MMLRKYYVIYACVFTLSMYAQAQSFLVLGGKTGWVGQKVATVLEDAGHTVFRSQVRLEDRVALSQEIDAAQPDCIVNAAGVTGRPNVDWCEDHKQETIRANLVGALTLFDVACSRGIHVINFGTGCIYEYDEQHPLYSGIGFKEEEEPNFQGSFYSFTKTMLDKLVASYPNVVNLRLRMPISDDLHSRSFITKITKYQRVVNVPNSMSVLHDLLPLIPEIARRKLVGNYNFVNPGVISHNEILDLYKEYIDSSFTYQNFTVEEQNKILKAGRSNNELNARKLLNEFPQLLSIKESMVGVFQRMKESMQ